MGRVLASAALIDSTVLSPVLVSQSRSAPETTTASLVEPGCHAPDGQSSAAPRNSGPGPNVSTGQAVRERRSERWPAIRRASGLAGPITHCSSKSLVRATPPRSRIASYAYAKVVPGPRSNAAMTPDTRSHDSGKMDQVRSRESARLVVRMTSRTVPVAMSMVRTAPQAGGEPNLDGARTSRLLTPNTSPVPSAAHATPVPDSPASVSTAVRAPGALHRAITRRSGDRCGSSAAQLQYATSEPSGDV